jgi:tetratricopeptide (TPR) repeat protein/transcriptional regulator with XRE-family HTH domain
MMGYELSFGQRLRLERLQRNLTQKELAEQLKVSQLTVTRWEKDQFLPQPAQKRSIYAFFKKSPEEFGKATLLWNVPFTRNPHFRGRDDILITLHKSLAHGGNIALTQHALSGLGGIGKTQTAVEYAFRYRHEYSAVLWVRADSPELLNTDFSALATVLQLDEKTTRHQSQATQAVKEWLYAHTGWLLIFDNVEDVHILHNFLPTWHGGSVLITTRAQVRGRYIKKLEIEKFTQEESLLFLLQRSKISPDEHAIATLAEEELQSATQLCEQLDGLPLALDQAAAYIEENQCRITAYLQLFLNYRAKILAWRSSDRDYPYSVATTWTISFQKIEQAHAASADLLQLCAFLHPDAIPEELFSEGAAQLGPRLQGVAHPLILDSVINPLFTFSLIRRDRTLKILTIHRLVQAVLQDKMSNETYRTWAERAVRAVNSIFPSGDFEFWPRCEIYLPHAQQCATLIQQQNIYLPEAVTLLNKAGNYLNKRARYKEALPILKQALKVSEQVFGPEHLTTADVLHNLVFAYRELGDYDSARPIYERVLTIRQQQLGSYHPDIASILDELGFFYHEDGNLHRDKFPDHAQESFAQAEAYYKQALAIRQQTLGQEHPDTLKSLENLTEILLSRQQFAEVEQAARELFALRKRILGAEHADTITAFENIALADIMQNNYEESEKIIIQVLDYRKRFLGFEHRLTATTLHNLAYIYHKQERYEDAENHWRQALIIRYHILGANHPDTHRVENFLRNVYEKLGRPTALDTLLAELKAREAQEQAEAAEETNNMGY